MEKHKIDAATLDYVISGMEAALELERELGVRVIECDRGLLAPVAATQTANSATSFAPPASPAAIAASPARSTVEQGNRGYDFVFLHERTLSAAGAEMIAKITSAMKRTSETAPVVVEAPPPPARVYVVLGLFALKKFFPELRGAPGQWLKSGAGADVLVSNSPEYILRFGTESAAVKKIKQDMWRSLKTVEQRLAAK